MSLLSRANQAFTKDNKLLCGQLEIDIKDNDIILQLNDKSLREKLIKLNETNEFLPYYFEKLNINPETNEFKNVVFIERLENIYPFCVNLTDKDKEFWETQKIPVHSNFYEDEKSIILFVCSLIAWKRYDELNKIPDEGISVNLALILACQYGDIEIVMYLLNEKKAYTRPVINSGLCMGDITNLRLREGININRDVGFCIASAIGDLDKVKYYLEQGATCIEYAKQWIIKRIKDENSDALSHIYGPQMVNMPIITTETIIANLEGRELTFPVGKRADVYQLLTPS